MLTDQHALQPLLKWAGGPLHTQDAPKRNFRYEDRDAARLPFCRACKIAGMPRSAPANGDGAA